MKETGYKQNEEISQLSNDRSDVADKLNKTFLKILVENKLIEDYELGDEFKEADLNAIIKLSDSPLSRSNITNAGFPALVFSLY